MIKEIHLKRDLNLVLTSGPLQDSDLTIDEALWIAEDIGTYIRSVTKQKYSLRYNKEFGESQAETPIVHVFLKGKHVGVAYPSTENLSYKAKKKIQDWMAWDKWEE